MNLARLYGTKRYAGVVLRGDMRAYAKARRRAWNSESYSLISERSEANTRFLGAWSALAATGVITSALADRYMRRHQRIQAARISRRPLAELKAAA